jgi:poly-gamma-glutamate capsule biosynthesis protein CapA/YwtB (metallophosphatase superfamily)
VQHLKIYRVVIGLLSFILLSACSNGFFIDEKPVENKTTHYVKGITVDAADFKAPPVEPPPEQPITIKFTGDILLDSAVGYDIERYGVDYPFEKVASLLKDADLTVGNLETSVSTRGTPQEKEFTFRSKPNTLKGLVDAGFDAVTIANNHTLDYGRDALLDTIHYLDQYKIGHMGAGKNEEEAFKAYYTTVKDKRIAIVGLSRVLPYGSWYALKNRPGIASAYQSEPMYSYVKKAVANSDYTIVFIHWNKERMDYPESYAKTMARAFIELGVDAVIGSHSHSLMGMEVYNGAPIFYSMGNFVFTPNKSPKGSETMIAQLTFKNGKMEKTSVVPAKIIHEQPTLMNIGYNRYIYTKLSKISYNVHVDDQGNVLLNH